MGCHVGRMFCLLESSCIWTWGPLLPILMRGNTAAPSMYVILSAVPGQHPAGGGNMSWGGFAQKRGKQLARKPVCVHRDTFLQLCCLLGWGQCHSRADFRLSRNDKLLTVGAQRRRRKRRVRLHYYLISCFAIAVLKHRDQVKL